MASSDTFVVERQRRVAAPPARIAERLVDTTVFSLRPDGDGTVSPGR